MKMRRHRRTMAHPRRSPVRFLGDAFQDGDVPHLLGDVARVGKVWRNIGRRTTAGMASTTCGAERRGRGGRDSRSRTSLWGRLFLGSGRDGQRGWQSNRRFQGSRQLGRSASRPVGAHGRLRRCSVTRRSGPRRRNLTRRRPGLGSIIQSDRGGRAHKSVEESGQMRVTGAQSGSGDLSSWVRRSSADGRLEC